MNAVSGTPATVIWPSSWAPIVINANRIAGVQRRDRSQSLLSLEGLAEELKLGRTATSRLASLEDPKPRR